MKENLPGKKTFKSYSLPFTSSTLFFRHRGGLCSPPPPARKVFMRTSRRLDSRRRSRTNRRVTWYAKSGDYANWRRVCVEGVPAGVTWFHVYLSLQLKISNETRFNMGIKSLQWEQRRKEGYFAVYTTAKLLQMRSGGHVVCNYC